MLNVFSKSDVGLVRQTNEDACRNGIYSDHSAWAVVCDGMGGANGGNVASGIAVESISAQLVSEYRPEMTGEEIRTLMFSAIRNANRLVHEKAAENASLSGMGTTVVAAIVSRGVAHVAHAGDSRAYLISPDAVRQLTTDHSMVQEMLDKGDITEQQAKSHPQKNIITRALGVEPSIELDYSENEFVPGDRLLICTDGLTNYVDAGQIYRLSRNMDAQTFVDELIGLAKDGGGSDNITVALVEY